MSSRSETFSLKEGVIKLRSIISTQSVLCPRMVLDNNFLHWWHIIGRHAVTRSKSLLMLGRSYIIEIERECLFLSRMLLVGIVDHCVLAYKLMLPTKVVLRL
mmetsp:Transcript_39903/g.86016  ORF Transcript_39903/g.86016 Transcript_39903/m.86016 type:complete len:102 (-) Transcript_39903:758-1063(-)